MFIFFFDDSVLCSEGNEAAPDGKSFFLRKVGENQLKRVKKKQQEKIKKKKRFEDVGE